MWLRNIATYDNEWYKNDEDFDPIPGVMDSIDENVIAAEDYYAKREEQEAYMKQCNLYQKIDKLHAKHLETTEL